MLFQAIRQSGVRGLTGILVVCLAWAAQAQILPPQDPQYPEFDPVDCASTAGLVPQSPDGCVGESGLVGRGAEAVWSQGTAPPSNCYWNVMQPWSDACGGPILPHGVSYAMGFRLNVSLLAANIPGDFLPVGNTLAATTLPLIPPGMASAPTSWNGLSRPIIAGNLDPVTGSALVRVTDLELPLDGATFRFTRTRGNRTIFNPQGGCIATDGWWDFTGGGWMIGENPLLLVDSALPDAVGNNPRMCHLVMDAHSSISFQQIESSGLYEAPARFRARMEHNGTWDTGERRWAVRPTIYTISLFEGAVTYTFAVVPEDVPEHDWNAGSVNAEPDPRWERSSYHARPFLPQQFPDRSGHNPLDNNTNPGFGMPYLALCTSMEDQYGHVVEMNYASVTWSAADFSDSIGCVECAQACPSKGQLRSLRLGTRRTDGSLDVKWTVAYVHRLIAPEARVSSDSSLNEWNAALAEKGVYGSVAIDRIYVYEGDRSSEIASIPSTLPPSDLMMDARGELSLDGGTDPLAGRPALADWKYSIRHHYNYERTVDQSDFGRVHSPPALLKTTVESRDVDTAPAQARARVYVYAPHDTNSNASLPWLCAMFDADDLGRLFAADACEADGVQPLLANTSVNDLAEARWTAGSSCEGLNINTFTDRVLAFASARWDPAGANTLPQPQELITRPALGRKYVDVPQISRVAPSTFGSEPRDLSVRDGSGRLRHFRVFRYWYAPTQALADPGVTTFGSINVSAAPQRSVFVAPYAWRGYAGDAALTQPPNLAEPRWIVIVDEFDTRESMVDGSYGSGEGYQETYTKPGQVSRKVMQISASGVKLKERQWMFGEGGTQLTGSGVGEESISPDGWSVLFAPCTPRGGFGWHSRGRCIQFVAQRTSTRGTPLTWLVCR